MVVSSNIQSLGYLVFRLPEGKYQIMPKRRPIIKRVRHLIMIDLILWCFIRAQGKPAEKQSLLV